MDLANVSVPPEVPIVMLAHFQLTTNLRKEIIVSRSEFRWNKKRKHYAYIFKDKGHERKNMLITSKSVVLKHKNGRNKVVLINIALFHHPNSEK